MPVQTRINRLVEQIDTLVQTAVSEPAVTDAELRRVLKFISQVVQVVELSFQEVLNLLLDIKFLDEDDIHPHRLYELRKNAEMITARSYYRDAAEICSRLKHLGGNFDEFVKPIINNIPNFFEWRDVFRLIEHREGQIIMLIEESAGEINELLRRAEKGELILVRNTAFQRIEELKLSLKYLRDLNGRILGLSGGVGFLELTSNRNELQRELRIMIDQRDQSVTHGHRISTGDGTIIHGNMAVATTILDSFKTISEPGMVQDLKAKLRDLCSQVEAMLNLLPDDIKKNAMSDLACFILEATKDKPRRKWCELSAESLIEIVKDYPSISSNVIPAIKKMFDILY